MMFNLLLTQFAYYDFSYQIWKLKLIKYVWTVLKKFLIVSTYGLVIYVNKEYTIVKKQLPYKCNVYNY